MKYRLSPLNPEHPTDQEFIKIGLHYRVVQCTEAEEKALAEINALVMISRAALKRVYSGTLNDEQFDQDISLLKSNDARIQELSAIAHVPFDKLDPFASGRGFIED